MMHDVRPVNEGRLYIASAPRFDVGATQGVQQLKQMQQSHKFRRPGE